MVTVSMTPGEPFVFQIHVYLHMVPSPVDAASAPASAAALAARPKSPAKPAKERTDANTSITTADGKDITTKSKGKGKGKAQSQTKQAKKLDALPGLMEDETFATSSSSERPVKHALLTPEQVWAAFQLQHPALFPAVLPDETNPDMSLPSTTPSTSIEEEVSRVRKRPIDEVDAAEDGDAN